VLTPKWSRHMPVLHLIPRGAMAGAFLVTVWLIALFLFTPLQRSPFIYFQF
jgi:hypothetical protein